MTEPTLPGSHGEVRTEADRFTARPLLAVVAAVVILFLVAVFWAWRLQLRLESTFETSTDRPTPPTHAYRYEVGLSNQQPFALVTRAARTRAAERASLERLEWADRAGGQVQLPLSRGIQRLLRGEKPGGAP
jgi:hypothetical protein